MGCRPAVLKHQESLPQTVEEMVGDYLDQIRKIQPGGPYHPLGWSFGGVVAYAIANRLQFQGEQVAVLSLLDSYPIDKESPRHPRDDQQIITTWLQNLGYDPATLGQGPLQLSTIKELFQRESHISSNLEDRHLAALLEVCKNNERLGSTFRRSFALYRNTARIRATGRTVVPTRQRTHRHSSDRLLARANDAAWPHR
jgi:nonribosomal peptide synthetase DhbF